jgi:DNA-binding MarR family transcriptional regulator
MSRTLNMTAKRREALELVARNEHVTLSHAARGDYPPQLLVLAGPDQYTSKSLGRQLSDLERAGLVTVQRSLGITSYRVRITDDGRKALEA